MSICFERIFLTNQTRVSASLVITNSLIPIHKQLGLSTVRMASDSKVGDTPDKNTGADIQPEQVDVRKMKPTILRRQLTQAWNKRSDTLYVKQFGPKAIPMELYPTKAKYGEIEDTDSAFHLAWESKPEHVLIVTKPGDIKITEKFKEVASFLINTKGFTLYLESEAKSDPKLQSFSLLPLISTLQNPSIVDFVICIGGDGTFLYATSLFKNLSIPPIMCFGMGSLGFLTHFDAENFKDDIDRVTNKHMSVTLRSRISAKIIPEQKSCSIDEQIFSEDSFKSLPTDGSSPGHASPKLHRRRTRAIFSESGDVNIIEEFGIPKTKDFSCINEVTVDRGVSPYLTQIEIYLNDFKITTAQADGIIVATPTGSTAYSLAAGASMLHPSTEAFIITPICPHSLSFRPIVVPNGVQIKLKLSESSRHSAWVSFDGRDRQEFKLDETIHLSLDPNPVPCLNNTGHVSDWFKSLINGLNWNVRLGQKKL